MLQVAEGQNGAGIGGGFNGSGGTITIGGSGGGSGSDGAGIGGGYRGSGGTVIIGDSVTVSGIGSIPAKPAGVAPTSIGAADGKITGTTTAMEYKKTDADDSTYANCTGTEIDNLSPGSYSVRIKAVGENSINAAVTVTVPDVAPTVTGISPSSGPISGETSVTITGTGFTGATAVKFGNSNASNITAVNDTHITATAPAGNAGEVDVTVTTPGGTSAASPSDKYTYVQPYSQPYIPPEPVQQNVTVPVEIGTGEKKSIVRL